MFVRFRRRGRSDGKCPLVWELCYTLATQIKGEVDVSGYGVDVRGE